ncbi:MAG TPA: phospholipid carrier-dependent glycosyltransferase [Chthoniobacterales bacterium]|nr:phospholipid carrier-dependent glycosyltransferase [Chthoniobacterales bacterium]
MRTRYRAFRDGWAFPVGIALIIVAAALLRLCVPAGFDGIGFDENLYRGYVELLSKAGVTNYPLLAEQFIDHQLEPKNQAILPPTRIFYIGGGYVYHRVFGLSPLAALHALSAHFSILTVVVSAVFCWRVTRRRDFTAAVTALVACAPTQIHMGQHALIDGVFGFWALLVMWLLWENLQQRDSTPWLISYAAALAVLVMTKENAAFVAATITAILALNHWLRFGQVTRRLVITTFAATLVGLTAVVLAAGGVEQFVLIFSLLKVKVPALAFMIRTAGGPWHRYLVDLLLVSPIVVMLAGAALLNIRGSNIPGQAYVAVFVALSYTVLALFPAGMNLRFIVMLDMPLRFLAGVQLLALSRRWGRYQRPLLVCAVVALCGYELRQHYILFIKGSLYELVTEGLIYAQGIIK